MATEIKMQSNSMKIAPGNTNEYYLTFETNEHDLELEVICTTGTFQFNAWGPIKSTSPVMTAGEDSGKLVITTAKNKKVLGYLKAGDSSSELIVAY